MREGFFEGLIFFLMEREFVLICLYGTTVSKYLNIERFRAREIKRYFQ